MDSKEIEPPKGPKQNRIGVLCLTVMETFILLVLRTQFNDDIIARGSR